MSANNFANDGQAKACPFFVLAAGKVRLVEALEDSILFAAGDPDSVILDGDEDLPVLLIGLKPDGGAGSAEFDGIVDQIVENLLNAVLVGVDIEHAAGQDQLQRNFLFQAGLLKGSGHLPDGRIDVKICPVQNHSLGVQVVQRQKIIGQLGQTVGLIQNNAEVFLMHFGRNGSIQHSLKKAADRGEGRAEVVGDVGNEFFLVILGACNLLRHVAERCGQVTDFILTVRSQLVMHVPCSVLLRGLCDPAKGEIHDLREEDQNDQGKEQENQELHVGNVEIAVCLLVKIGNFIMDGHIAVGFVAPGNRSQDRELFGGKIVPEIPFNVEISAKGGRVKAFHADLGFRINPGVAVDYDPAGRVHDHDVGIQVGAEGIQLLVDTVDGGLGIVKLGGIGIGNGGRFAVQVVRLLTAGLIQRHVGDKGCHNNKAEAGKENIGKKKFQIQRFSHVLIRTAALQPFLLSATHLPQIYSRCPRWLKFSRTHGHEFSRGFS